MLLIAALVVAGVGPAPVEALAREPPSDRAPAAGAGVVAHLETRSALPTLIWAEAGPSLKALGLDAGQAARRHLWTYASRWRWTPPELAAQPLISVHDTGEGAILATFRRPEVFRETLVVVMDRELRAVALTGYLSPGALPDTRTPPGPTATPPTTGR